MPRYSGAGAALRAAVKREAARTKPRPKRFGAGEPMRRQGRRRRSKINQPLGIGRERWERGFNIQHSTFNVQRSAFNVQRSTLNRDRMADIEEGEMYGEYLV